MGYINDNAKLQYALDKLRYYNKFIWFGLPTKTFESPEIIKGLDAPFNSDEEKRAIKMLVTASTETIMSDKGIPQSRKRAMVRKNADELQKTFDLVKYEITPMSKPDREKLERDNIIAKRVKMVERGKRILKRSATRKTINLVTATLIGTTGPVGIVGGIVYGIITLMPDKVKKKIKEKAIDAIDKGLTTIENIADKVKETPIGQKISTVINDIKNSKVGTTVREVVKDGKEVAEGAFTRVTTKVKDGAKRVWSFVKSLF